MNRINGIQVPVAVVGTWVALMAILVSRRKSARPRQRPGEPGSSTGETIQESDPPRA